MKRILTFLLFAICIVTFTFVGSAETSGKTELGQLLEKSFDASVYTPESYASYQTSAAAALSVYLDPAATDEQIDDVLTQLKQAEENLIFILDTDKLLTFANNLEQEFIYNNNLVLSNDLKQRLTDACEEFRTLYNSGSATEESVLQAEEKFNLLVEEAEEKAKDAGAFSANNPGEGVVVPSDYKEVKQSTSGKVTQLRMILSVIGGVCLILGTVTAVLYFRQPEFLKRKLKSKTSDR